MEQRLFVAQCLHEFFIGLIIILAIGAIAMIVGMCITQYKISKNIK